jgi:hypothetical protein
MHTFVLTVLVCYILSTCSQEVGQVGLPAMLDLLSEPGLADDQDMAKAVLETLNILCELEETEPGRPPTANCGVTHVDTFLMACLSIKSHQANIAHTYKKSPPSPSCYFLFSF